MQYVDGDDSLGKKLETQARVKPKRRSVFS